MRCPVEYFCDGAEAFLPRRVPNLQLKALVLNFDAQGAKLYANRAVVLCIESVLRESVEYARFTDSYMKDHEQRSTQ